VIGQKLKNPSELYNFSTGLNKAFDYCQVAYIYRGNYQAWAGIVSNISKRANITTSLTTTEHCQEQL